MVKGYQGVETAFVGAYKKIESAFVNAFLEKAEPEQEEESGCCPTDTSGSGSGVRPPDLAESSGSQRGL